MIRNINTDVYRRLGLVSSDENDNFSDRVSKYTEVLNNKNYSIFLENVTLKTTINDYISNSSNFVARAEGTNNTKKNFFRKIIDRILEIWDKFLDWLYRVQIKIVTSRLFKKVNSILGKLKKKFGLYPIEIKIKTYIKEGFIDDSSLNEYLEKYAKKFENGSTLVKNEFENMKKFSDKLKKDLDNSDDFFINNSLKKYNNLNIFEGTFNMNHWDDMNTFLHNIVYNRLEEYTTLIIKNKEEDTKIKSSLTKKIEQIKLILERVDRQFNELYKMGKNVKKSIEELTKEIDRRNIDNKHTIKLINEIYEDINRHTADLTKKTSEIVQNVNKHFSKELIKLEADLSEFLK